VSKRLLVSVVLCAVMLPGCGGSPGADRAQTATTPASPDVAPAPAMPADPREVPAGVPLKATRAADPARANVVRAWSAALRAGDIDAANALWATPAKAQNGTPVMTLSSRETIGVFNESLPCGSVVTSAGGAPGGFTIAKVRLTRRKGARCDAVGATARTAILVRDGRIVEWYRLPDDPGAPGPQPPVDAMGSTEV
jgi:limonene-1,2-epoxide hydrolase